MPKKPVNTTEELLMMRMSIRAMRQNICQNLDAMVARLDLLLPAGDDEKYHRIKNLSKQDIKSMVDSW